MVSPLTACWFGLDQPSAVEALRELPRGLRPGQDPGSAHASLRTRAPRATGRHWTARAPWTRRCGASTDLGARHAVPLRSQHRAKAEVTAQRRKRLADSPRAPGPRPGRQGGPDVVASVRCPPTGMRSVARHPSGSGPQFSPAARLVTNDHGRRAPGGATSVRPQQQEQERFLGLRFRTACSASQASWSCP